MQQKKKEEEEEEEERKKGKERERKKIWKDLKKIPTREDLDGIINKHMKNC